MLNVIKKVLKVMSVEPVSWDGKDGKPINRIKIVFGDTDELLRTTYYLNPEYYKNVTTLKAEDLVDVNFKITTYKEKYNLQLHSIVKAA